MFIFDSDEKFVFSIQGRQERLNFKWMELHFQVFQQTMHRLGFPREREEAEKGRKEEREGESKWEMKRNKERKNKMQRKEERVEE